MKTKTLKIALEGFGSYLGMEKGCFIVRNKEGKTAKYPVFEQEISEVQIKTGNLISSGALASCGTWAIPVHVLTQRGRPVATLRSLDDDSHVKTRVCQYEALHNGKGLNTAKQIVLAKLEGYDQLLKKHGLRGLDVFSYQQRVKAIIGELDHVRARLMKIEGDYSKQYFMQTFTLFNEALRPESRRTWKAFDGINNILNLCYEMLSWKVHNAVLNAKLEPYLGFLHAIAHGTPSLVCDLEELYRPCIDSFAVEYCKRLSSRDFTLKVEDFHGRKGKRQYLNDTRTKDLMNMLNRFFESKIELPRIKHGKRQEVETVINEEAMLFAQYLRNEKQT